MHWTLANQRVKHPINDKFTSIIEVCPLTEEFINEFFIIGDQELKSFKYIASESEKNGSNAKKM